MSRQELVAAATAAGIKKASSTKSSDLEAALANVSKAKVGGSGTKGRPVNPDSKRQAKMSAPKTGKKGRPVVEGSARQLREAAKAARAAANGGEVKRGRPSQPKAEVTAVASEAQVG
jgi:hypothetical protein